MTIRMMVFDMAGTTVNDEDNAVGRCVAEAVAAAGARVSIEDVNPLMGTPKPRACAILLEAGGVDPEPGLVERVHADFQRRIVEHYRSGPGVREMDGASDMFRALRAMGVRVTLDTGFDRVTADVIIQRLGWGPDLIDDSVTSDEVERGRPDPEMIRVLMGRAGVDDASEVGKVGDSVSDLEQGLNAGCGFVGAVLSDRTRPVVDRYAVTPIEDITEIPWMIARLETAGGVA